MSDLQNPYQPPENSDSKTAFDPQADDFDKKGMLSLIAATALLGGLDYWLLGWGILAALGPIVLFFLITLWSVMAATRAGKLSIVQRVVAGVLLSMVSVPVSFALLLYTCVPAIAAAGLDWDIHAGGPLGNTFLFGVITAVMIGLVGLILFCLAFVLPRALKQRMPDVRESNTSKNGS